VEGVLVEAGDHERALVLQARLREQLVLACAVDRAVVLQVADVGDVLHQLDPQAAALGGRRMRSVSRKVRRFPTCAYR
jgi:hypothetical protein